MKLIDVGYGNTVNADKIIAFVSAEAAPTKRMMSAAKDKNMSIDATCGHKTKSIIVMESGHIVLSAKDVEKFTELENKDE